jgi:hypothetical protein
MNNLFAAVMTKCAGSDLSSAVGGRIYESEAPAGAEYPYVVFSVIAGAPEDNFTDAIDELVVQFSIYSISESSSEIAAIYQYLKNLFDYGALTISGYSHIGMIRQSMTTMIDDVTTTAGTGSLRHWAVDYLVRTEI